MWQKLNSIVASSIVELVGKDAVNIMNVVCDLRVLQVSSSNMSMQQRSRDSQQTPVSASTLMRLIGQRSQCAAAYLLVKMLPEYASAVLRDPRGSLEKFIVTMSSRAPLRLPE